ncbi:MAPEG family protein [Jannaschia donghaensis]|uniref:Putative relative of glutathione S-transferase, MAPEG superfamily n=1 Tax=Jannaschia donghaensis TaxID=420998 RepID=A0A0M6YMC9_9RHOB|nr:MAPEG family protein [Jannaschia donghaensis]CTQ50805.1 putative relative of glutathione S-transferase, MAPEG superfamily [Jannaschia donghaensis]
MTPELGWMAWTAILAGSLWIPYIVGINTAADGTLPDGADPFRRPQDPNLQRPWVARAFRAHLNLLEQFLPMLALVLIADAAGIKSPVTVWATGLFFGLRLIHAVGMITGTARMPLRPLVFTTGWLCIMAVGATIVTSV